MRLVTKISLYHFLLSAVVLGLAGILLFIFLRNEISREIEEQLELQLDMVAEELGRGKQIDFPLVTIRKDNEKLMQMPKMFKDTLIYDHVQKVNEGYYYFEESKRIGRMPYRIRVMTTYIGWENYSKTIAIIFISIAVTLVLIGILFNYFISRQIWRPFLINLKRMKGYSVSSKEELQLIRTNVTEFKEMNMVLTDLAARGKREYTALKEFTENASHEIQTPLSILKARLESMSQIALDANLVKPLNDAKLAVTRLSKVNKGLLLLAKLENNSFADKQSLQLDELLKNSYEMMEDLFQHKNLSVKFQLKDKQVFANLFLMEVLITNLLSNLLSHTASGAKIGIVLNDKEFTFLNEGAVLAFPESKLFSRFGKGAPGYKGNGLGLSIVKQICVLNDWQIGYTYQDGMHVFKVQF
ncbi:signal transduction histidine kinase [Pedobacter sp. AK017]|uniref:sensor histidine kinase n=1 Tax=Pedobacter sp. AK017 TaxID=2723073 RepID=UPI00161B7B69|nr:HAMP domain-containing sensor histidine kinase [Pedobacter sp. AK017]MBB5438969.1 signal transduction histidine kinase [Pedobacter sp. AK017]